MPNGNEEACRTCNVQCGLASLWDSFRRIFLDRTHWKVGGMLVKTWCFSMFWYFMQVYVSIPSNMSFGKSSQPMVQWLVSLLVYFSRHTTYGVCSTGLMVGGMVQPRDFHTSKVNRQNWQILSKWSFAVFTFKKNKFLKLTSLSPPKSNQSTQNPPKKKNNNMSIRKIPWCDVLSVYIFFKETKETAPQEVEQCPEALKISNFAGWWMDGDGWNELDCCPWT